MDITLKLKKLAEAALLLNGCGAVWGLGGSAMLYLRGATADFHDLDILVREEDAAAARSALDCAFDRLPARPNPGYATKYFYEYTSEDVDLDFIAGFSIKKNGENHPCPFDSHHVDGAVSIFGETVPLQSVCDWRQYYSLMGREEKAATLCFFSPRTRMITVRPLEEVELAAATDFAFPLYGDSASRGYPLFCDSERLASELEFCFSSDTGFAAAALCGGRIAGVAAGFTSGDFLQTTVLCAAPGDSEVCEALLGFIRGNFPSHKLTSGISSGFTAAACALQAFGYKKTEDCADLRLALPADPGKTDDRFLRVTGDLLPEYLDFHRASFPNIYWNADRISNDIGSWIVFGYRENGRFTSGGFARCGGGLAEIYGLKCADSADIAPAIRFCVSEVQAACPDTNTLVYLADSDDKDYIDAAKRCGFLENDRYLYFEKQ